MNKLLVLLLFVFACLSCAPTNKLSLDVINPADFTFPDTGKIVILNAAYSPEVCFSPNNLLYKLDRKEQLIFDTIIVTNIFDGLFSILNQSTNIELLNSEYQEIRTVDTSNFRNPISQAGIQYLCEIYNASFLVVLEYFDFNRYSYKNEFNYDISCWESRLEVSRNILWRIYSRNGDVLEKYDDADTLYWFENIDSNDHLPELTDAVREIFFIAGEKFGQRISPFWREISRQYFFISNNGEDISLDKDALILWKQGKNKTQQSRACYNLAVIAESEDNLNEASKQLIEAYDLKPSELIVNYKKKLDKRIETREIIILQSAFLK